VHKHGACESCQWGVWLVARDKGQPSLRLMRQTLHAPVTMLGLHRACAVRPTRNQLQESKILVTLKHNHKHFLLEINVVKKELCTELKKESIVNYFYPH